MAEVMIAKFQSHQAILFNYVYKTVGREVYPVITRQSDSAVDGLPCFNLAMAFLSTSTNLKTLFMRGSRKI
jgi:hypothetical protein